MIWSYSPHTVSPPLLSPPLQKGRGVRVSHLTTCNGKKSCHIPAAKSWTTLAVVLCLWGALEGAVSNSSLKIIFLGRTWLLTQGLPRKKLYLGSKQYKDMPRSQLLTVLLESVFFWSGFCFKGGNKIKMCFISRMWYLAGGITKSSNVILRSENNKSNCNKEGY